MFKPQYIKKYQLEKIKYQNKPHTQQLEIYDKIYNCHTLEDIFKALWENKNSNYPMFGTIIAYWTANMEGNLPTTDMFMNIPLYPSYTRYKLIDHHYKVTTYDTEGKRHDDDVTIQRRHMFIPSQIPMRLTREIYEKIWDTPFNEDILLEDGTRVPGTPPFECRIRFVCLEVKLYQLNSTYRKTLKEGIKERKQQYHLLD